MDEIYNAVLTILTVDAHLGVMRRGFLQTRRDIKGDASGLVRVSEREYFA